MRWARSQNLAGQLAIIKLLGSRNLYQGTSSNLFINPDIPSAHSSCRRPAHTLPLFTFWVVVLVVCVDGLVKVIFTGDMWGGKELAMLCIMLLILGLPLTGTVMVLVTGVTAFGTSFRRTGEELEELVRRLLRGFSSSSEQLTPVTTHIL